jgi:Family of unknown function (DUF716)
MLGVAFTIEGLLFAFHLEGEPLNYNMHFLLVIVVFAAAICIFAEILYCNSILISSLRAQLVLLQGIWFCMIAKLLFEGTTLSLFSGSLSCGTVIFRLGFSVCPHTKISTSSDETLKTPIAIALHAKKELAFKGNNGRVTAP